MSHVFHALVLNLHQPAGNLEALLNSAEWEAKEILFALDRIPRSLWSCEDAGRVHLALSGTLLETLARPDFQERVPGIIKCGWVQGGTGNLPVPLGYQPTGFAPRSLPEW